MIRLSTPLETRTTLALAGHERQLRLLGRWLGMRGAGEDSACSCSGSPVGPGSPRRPPARPRSWPRSTAGSRAGRFGRQWERSRFRSPYLRNTLWEMGYAVDTVETAVDWSRAPELAAA